MDRWLGILVMVGLLVVGPVMGTVWGEQTPVPSTAATKDAVAGQIATTSSVDAGLAGRVAGLEQRVEFLSGSIDERSRLQREEVNLLGSQLEVSNRDALFKMKEGLINSEKQDIERLKASINDYLTQSKVNYWASLGIVAIISAAIVAASLFIVQIIQHDFKEKARSKLNAILKENQQEIADLVTAKSRESRLLRETKIKVLGADQPSVDALVTQLGKLEFEKVSGQVLLLRTDQSGQLTECDLAVLLEKLGEEQINEIIKEQSEKLLYLVYTKVTIKTKCPDDQLNRANSMPTLRPRMMELLVYHDLVKNTS
jgi:hypothetical protein